MTGEMVHIHILQAVKAHGLRSSKDTNGGYGTVNDFGSGAVAFLLKLIKRGTMNFPELLPAYVHAILKQQGHRVTYAVNALDPSADLVLIQTSIINYYEELAWADRIRRAAPQVRIGFMGGMSAGNPQLYNGRGDFVLLGEAENALLHGDLSEFSGLVDYGLVPDLEALPFPDWSYLPQHNRGYGFLRIPGSRCFLPMLSSRACPMSCAYYCTYPLVQGASFRGRSAENVVDEIAYLQERFGMTTLMFRDPIFSLKMERVEQICELILQRGLNFSWICETHPRLLSAQLAALMRRAGCVAVKLGIEAGDLEVMVKSHRSAPDLLYQEQIVRTLEKNGIQVLAFYILGYFADTAQSIEKTISYANHLNSYGAQFTIATPYPGTPWHSDLSSQPQTYPFDANLEHYNQYQLVYRHPHLGRSELEGLKSQAYRRYYLRWGYIRKHFLKV
jgi:anaerobic magnesium-protoporphyrin IX monomethyl ester cyclase